MYSFFNLLYLTIICSISNSVFVFSLFARENFNLDGLKLRFIFIDIFSEIFLRNHNGYNIQNSLGNTACSTIANNRNLIKFLIVQYVALE